DFEQAQKGWLKLIRKLEDAKKLSDEAKEKLTKSEPANRAIQSDSGVSDEQKRKVKETVETLKKESAAQESKFNQLNEDMNNARPEYEKNMTTVLNRTHEFEKNRLEFFKQMFQDYHDSLFRIKPENLEKASTDFKKALESHNSTKDIAWWNSTYGTGSSAGPKFEGTINT
ncbi:unnamed protein product, partial [Didymodactylos carnosus]